MAGIRPPDPRPCFDCVCGDHSWTASTRGYVVVVSRGDSHLIRARSWCAAPRAKSVYAQARIKGTLKYLHQLVEPGAPEVDHINHWGMDNRRTNLRSVNRQQNMANARPRNKENRTSPFKGVSWARQSGKWVAFFGRSSGSRYLGMFDTEIEAAKAYDAQAKKDHGAFAYLNFPEAV